MFNSIEVKLAPIEFQILQILMENPGNVFSRNELIEKIWVFPVVISIFFSILECVVDGVEWWNLEGALL